MAARFRNDFNAALDEPLPLPIVFEGFEGCLPKYAANSFDRFDNIGQAGNRRPRDH
jgi:hypothetical protein